MRRLLEWLGKNRWAAFLVHQLFILVTAVVFLTSVRRISGRSVHLGADPIGVIDGVALVILSLGIIFLTRYYYRLVTNEEGGPLGLGLSIRRAAEFVIGLVLGFSFSITPWIIAVYRDTAQVVDNITNHFSGITIILLLSTASILLFLQAVAEETANRAFPMRLWAHRSLIFRLVVPSMFFVLIHLVSESFGWERVAVLFMAGILQGCAYALTGNVWFASGMHTGANLASFSVTGLWHAGSVVALSGQPAISNWVMVLIMMAVLGSLLIAKRRYGVSAIDPFARS